MKKINLLAVALATVTLFSCQKQELANSELVNDGKPISVTLKLGSVDDPSSKAIELPADAVTPATLSGGLVFFISADGYVVNVSDIDISKISTLAGQTFPGIKSSAKEVVIVGNYIANYPSMDAPLRGCLTKTAIQNITGLIGNNGVTTSNILLTNVIDATGFAAYDGLIKKVNPNYEARVLLGPVMSRIQIADIKTLDPSIVSFKFAGMYLDNYYPSFFLSPNKGGAGSLVTIGTDATKLAIAGVPAKLYDVPTLPVKSVDKTVTAIQANGSGANLVWAYNTAPTNTDVTATPRIIVKLTDVEIVNPAGGANIILAGPKYLTITNFKSGANAVDDFIAGNVYNVKAGDFTFTLKDLADIPNATNITVAVIATIKPWVMVPVTPQL